MKEGPNLRPALPAQTPAVWTTRSFFADDYFRAVLTLLKVALQIGAKALDDCDDRDRDASGDKSVFDSSRAGLVSGETLN